MVVYVIVCYPENGEEAFVQGVYIDCDYATFACNMYNEACKGCRFELDSLNVCTNVIEGMHSA